MRSFASAWLHLPPTLGVKCHVINVTNDHMVCRDPAADTGAFQQHGGNILIGTPGRLSDIIKRTSSMDLKRLEVLVLDEADRLLEMGFKAELDAIMTRLPKQRRTGTLSF